MGFEMTAGWRSSKESVRLFLVCVCVCVAADALLGRARATAYKLRERNKQEREREWGLACLTIHKFEQQLTTCHSSAFLTIPIFFLLLLNY